MLDSPHGLAGQSVVGSLSWIGSDVTPELVEKVRSVWSGLARSTGGEAGVTRLTSGLLCRYRGASTSEVRNWFTDIWRVLRLSCLARPACLPRVWQM